MFYYTRIFGTPIILLTLLLYFTYHTVYGNRGVYSYFEHKNELALTIADLQTFRSQHIELDHKVRLLKDQSIDLDMLEEQARETLGYAAKNEQVYVIETQQ